MKKIIDIEITHEWIGAVIDKSKEEEKTSAKLRRELKELKEKCPIRIQVAFKVPDWTG